MWLHSNLTKEYPHLYIASIPDAPNVALVNEPEYVEKKRRQMARMFSKLCSRPEFFNSKYFSSFQTSGMV